MLTNNIKIHCSKKGYNILTNNILSLKDILNNMNASDLKLVNQVHGSKVVTLTNQHTKTSKINADSIITSLPSIAIGVRTADCVPVLLYTEDSKLIGAIHCGWKSILDNIIYKTIKKMNRISDHKIFANIGPSIKYEDYEVSGEFIKNFIKFDPKARHCVKKHHRSLHFDLPNFVQQKLLELNVTISYISNINTYKDESFPSYRRNGIKEQYRTLSLITIK